MTFDLIHAEVEWVNGKTFARKRDEVENTAVEKREA
jgi:hypothetical protein